MFTTTVSSSSSAVAASKTLEEEYVQHADLYDGSKQTQLFSGLQGRALNAKGKEFPSMAQVLAKIPKECFEKDTGKSLMYAGSFDGDNVRSRRGGVGDVAVYRVLFAGVDRVRVRGWDCGDWVLGCRARVRTRCVFG